MRPLSLVCTTSPFINGDAEIVKKMDMRIGILTDAERLSNRPIPPFCIAQRIQGCIAGFAWFKFRVPPCQIPNF